jgi:heme exporter protein A
MNWLSNYQTASQDNTRTDMGLQIVALSVMRGQRLIIDQLHHQQSAGTACLLTGANGTGKSTLLRTIAGRLPPDSGQIICTLQRVYIGHADGLAGAITGRQNLKGWAAIHDQFVTQETLDTALATFGTLSFADMPIQLLSRGQRRRLALARLALAPPQSLWLLDEPNAGLDTDANARLEKVILAHLAGGGAVIAATHGGLTALSSTIDLKLGSQ